MKLIIPGQPIAKARARTFQQGRKTITWDPQDIDKQTMQWKLKSEMKKLGEKPNVNPLYIKLDFYLMPHDGDPNRNLKLHGIDQTVTRKDLDNLEKFILDCGNKILYEDDSQVLKIESTKSWSENPRTEIEIIVQESMKLEDTEKKIINLFSPTEFAELFDDAKMLFVLAQENPMSSIPKENYLKHCAESLAVFAQKYGDKLHKINKYKKQKILHTVVEELQDTIYERSAE